MSGERIIRTFILAGLGLAIMGLIRPSSPDPLEDVRARQQSFFITKAHQSTKFDMVIIGDSRALRGLSPDEISRQLPGSSVFNFAFNSGGMNFEMYRAAENLLDSNSINPTIILAPTSLAFMPHKTGNQQYREFLAKPRDQVWLHSKSPVFADFFQPLSPSVYLRRALNIQPKRILNQSFHQNGWIATDQIPRDEASGLNTQRQVLKSLSVDSSLIDDFMAQTNAWSKKGISVFALFLPAYDPRVTLEDSLLGFDRREFQLAFENEGGTWLDVSGPDYQTYDGSHLVNESALICSRETGIKIAEKLHPGQTH